MWYRAVPEYSRWMMAETFPKMLAYIKAGEELLEEVLLFDVHHSRNDCETVHKVFNRFVFCTFTTCNSDWLIRFILMPVVG